MVEYSPPFICSPPDPTQGFPRRNYGGRVNAQMIVVGERPENILGCKLPRDGQHE